MGACKYPCYTFGGIYRDCYDVRVAQKVADVCNQRHHIIRLGNHFLRNFEKNAEKTVYISDGYFGVQNSYEVYLNRLARDIAPIRITGNYGGELLRSIQGILKAEPFNSELFNADLRPYFETARQTVENLYESADHPLNKQSFHGDTLVSKHRGCH
jgi:asparagine synthase (glutamine-hydrolysing)